MLAFIDGKIEGLSDTIVYIIKAYINKSNCSIKTTILNDQHFKKYDLKKKIKNYKIKF